jgi:hypothetical protein
MPSILTWQAQNTLAPYGALAKVDFVVQNALDDMKAVRIRGGIISGLVIVAGVLIGLRRKAGYYLLIGLCGIAVSNAVFYVVETQSIPSREVVQSFLWGFMLVSVFWRNRRHEATWWRENVRDSV